MRITIVAFIRMYVLLAARGLQVYEYPFVGLIIFAENRSVLIDKHEGKRDHKP